MKITRNLVLVTSFLSLTSAHGALSYEDLDHINPLYLDQVKSVNKNMGYANFEGVGPGPASIPYMITLFFDIDTVLTTTLMEYPEGSNLYSQYAGAFGMYVYNMQTGQVSQAPFFSSSLTVLQGNLAFTELNQSADSGLYQDQINVNVGFANFGYFDPNGSDGIDTTSTFNTSLGNTIRTAGFPFPVTPPPLANFAYSPTGPVWNADAINGNIHSTGIIAAVPEPSSMLMLSAACCATAMMRRRKAN
ncbi:MAG: PEP-CTERM sorting domain-containing protein [Verrucomicrobiaceae bacterium]|nr:MAG: PEP-CTERM sorting domain-containing protein [Verrucomicrobiaceae bacterium]